MFKDQSTKSKREAVLTAMNEEWANVKRDKKELERLKTMAKEKAESIEEITDRQRKARVSAITDVITDLVSELLFAFLVWDKLNKVEGEKSNILWHMKLNIYSI